MINLKDNTLYPPITDDIEKYISLQCIANRQVSDLLDGNDNSLLIYPYSFLECEDEIGKQSVLSLQIHWKGENYTKAILETGNLAGFIGVNNQNISIHSRFSEEERTDNDFFLHYMLQKVLSVNFFNLAHSTTNEPTFDFLLYLFPRFLNDALTQGLYKEYQKNEYNDANVKGSIDINRHIKKNIPFNGRIAYRTREFSHDNHVTELIRHTIEYISTQKMGKVVIENTAEVRANIAQIILATSNYKRQNREQVIKRNQRGINHPYFNRYAPLQKLCLKILSHQKMKYGHNKNEIYGILFDVSWLWEEYLASILISQGFKHPNNRKRLECIYLDTKNKFSRYPDYYDKNIHGIIIDAKYKPQIDRINDINQILTYMYRLKARWGILIQPTINNSINLAETYQLHGYGADENAKLQIQSFSIPQKACSYEDFKEQIKKSEEDIKSKIYKIKNNNTLNI